MATTLQRLGATLLLCSAASACSDPGAGDGGGLPEIDAADTGGSDAGASDAAPDAAADVPSSTDADAQADGVADADAAADAVDAAPDTGPPVVDPGFKAIHRLNRAEYNNTVRDLLGTTLRPADDFPADDISLGFDNIADTLSFSPLHFELALRAAELLVDEALRVPLAPVARQAFEAEAVSQTAGGASGDGWNLWSNGRIHTNTEFAYSGTYRFSAVAGQDAAGDAPAQMVLRIDGADAATFDVVNPRGAPSVYSAEVTVEAGTREVAFAFTNDFYDADAGLDRNLWLDAFAVEGPIALPLGTNPARERILVCSPPSDDAWRDCARRILEGFVPRAWRRPVTDEEFERLELLIERALNIDTSFEQSIGVALQAVLASPHFLYRIERDVDPSSVAPHPLDAYELASRLSYFLWSSMPDDELLALAATGELLDPGVIAAQVERMLLDERADALVDNFAGQWLFFRNIVNAAPDPWAYPDFDEELRAAMIAEAELFFETFVRSERSMLELLTADGTFVNERLAGHYGIDGVEGDTFVEVVGFGRGGLLRQAGLLTALSYPARTSPVRRGKFILGQLLCSEPEPPPADAGGLPEGEEFEEMSLRERMDMHRRDPACAACHTTMDPLGFGLENYDGLGQWRDFYGDEPIDATGILPDGTSFDGAEELAHVVAGNRAFAPCVAEKLYTYALGRPVRASDRTILRGISDSFATNGYTFEALAVAIATSDAFVMRRGEGE